MNDIRIFIYGSCCFYTQAPLQDEKLGRGGFGIVIETNAKITHELSGGFSNTVNARMDIRAITEALKQIDRQGSIAIYLSNGYIIDALTKGWLQKWIDAGFRKIKYADLWKELHQVLSGFPANTVTFKHAKQVQYLPGFIRAEKLAKDISMQENLPADLNPKDNPLFQGKTMPDITRNRPQPIQDSICVDASTRGNPGPTEYRGVDLASGKILFELKLQEATNNIGEFLAIVHALALCKKENINIRVIYSDSVNAISWVKQKKCKTKYGQTVHNKNVFELIHRAEAWLLTHTYNIQVLKWDTQKWGEIPADYGRK
ncbi:MAG: reverse transcriptase-like protein [Dysgonamonadaceae bacterium]|jgi:ribonuclease HI|nr:reverse transcriptase-like protein [Dysgonamonadaceae bacterium]